MEIELVKEIEDLRKRVDRLESIIQNDRTVIAKKKPSVREFLLSTKGDESLQKTLLLGYFLEKFDGLTSFTVKELERTFVMAKERVPTNTNDMINKNISKGFMMEAQEKRDSKKTWCLTNAGEKYVGTNLF